MDSHQAHIIEYSGTVELQILIRRIGRICSSIPTSKVKTSGDYVVPGFNEYAKELDTEARSCFIAWKSLGKPRAGLCYTDMCQSRLRFKCVLKHCQRNEDSLRDNALAKSYIQKD